MRDKIVLTTEEYKILLDSKMRLDLLRGLLVRKEFTPDYVILAVIGIQKEDKAE